MHKVTWLSESRCPPINCSIYARRYLITAFSSTLSSTPGNCDPNHVKLNLDPLIWRTYRVILSSIWQIFNQSLSITLVTGSSSTGSPRNSTTLCNVTVHSQLGTWNAFVYGLHLSMSDVIDEVTRQGVANERLWSHVEVSPSFIFFSFWVQVQLVTANYNIFLNIFQTTIFF